MTPDAGHLARRMQELTQGPGVFTSIDALRRHSAMTDAQFESALYDLLETGKYELGAGGLARRGEYVFAGQYRFIMERKEAERG